jgi:glycosyltransferase involved in cell wall biosynthesis
LKIGIISHTEHYKDSNDKIVGWGPTIKELNHLSAIADTIYHMAPLHDKKAPESSLEYSSDKIVFIPLKPSGGKRWKKLSILYVAPYNLYKIMSVIKKVDKLQFRAPTGMGIYVLPFLKLFSPIKYWVKYAGNWKSEKLPLGNKLQKLWLQNCTSLKTKITVNGNWAGERKNVLAFENPCLDEKDRRAGLKIIAEKSIEKNLNFCFVGALNEHKGVSLILEALQQFQNSTIEFHFVGDGDTMKKYVLLAEKLDLNIFFHGFLKKDEIVTIYKKCHYIVLPSKSEGFPKVIGEAMNFGCIPIVSNISCIEQYIQNDINGYLIEKRSVSNLVSVFKKALELDKATFKKYAERNYKIAEKFTYLYYNKRIKSEILY